MIRNIRNIDLKNIVTGGGETVSSALAGKPLYEISEQLFRYKSLKLIKKGFWVYLMLLLFEGALRKWLLPGLAGPLLIVRDPLAIWLIYLAFRSGYFPSTNYVRIMVIVTFISCIATLLIGHENLIVTVFGARILLIHFPLLFIFGNILSREDVVLIGKIILWISIPMTIILILQFYSPQSAWINRGVGGSEEGAGFAGALGYMRPPATFSFTNGTTLYYSILGCFVVYFWLSSKDKLNRILLLTSTFALLVAIPLSISRGLLFQVVLTTAIGILGVIIYNPKALGKVVLAIAFVCILGLLASSNSIFATASKVFSSRMDTASDAEGGLQGTLVDRFLGGMAKVIIDGGDLPFFGHGIGMGTNVGSQLLIGKVDYLIAEDEWGRLIGEMGLLLGLGVVLIRIALVFDIGVLALKRFREGDMLPWLLLSFGLVQLLQGQWGQPTSLGFSVIIGGLVIASLKEEVVD